MAISHRLSRIHYRLALMLCGLLCLTWGGCSSGDTPDAEQHAVESGTGGREGDESENGEADTAVADTDAAEDAEPEPPGEAPFDTTYLNSDTELFIFAKVGEILNSSLVQMLAGGNLAPLDQIERQIGIHPKDIDSLTVGVSNLSEVAKESAKAMQAFGPAAGFGPGFGPAAGFGPGAGVGGPPPELGLAPEMEDGAQPDAASDDEASTTAGAEEAVVVIRTSSAINIESLEQEGVERRAHGDQAYYVVNAPHADKTACLYLVEPQTLVVSNEPTIQEVIDEGEERPRPTADLGFVSTLPHLLVAVAPTKKGVLLKSLEEGEQKSGGESPDSSENRSMTYEEEMRMMENEYSEEDMSDQYEAEMAANYEREMYEQGGRRPGRSQGPQMPQLKVDSKLFEDHTEAVALLVDLSQGINVQVALRCDTTDSAGKIQGDIDKNLTEIRTAFEGGKEMLPGVIQKIAQPLVDSLSATATEAVVSVSTQLPEEQQSNLTLLPMAVMGMMMSGGLQMNSEIEMMASRREVAQEVINQGQPAANADELPAGLSVKGMLRWGESKYGDQAPPPLELAIVTQGGPAAEAISYGLMSLTGASIDAGRRLKWEGVSTTSFDADPLQSFVAIQRDGMFSDHPDDGVVTGYLFVPPASPVQALASVEGQFMLQVARSDEVLLTNLGRVAPADAAPGNDAMQQAALDVNTRNLAGQGQLDVSWNASPRIGAIEPVLPDGTLIQTAGTSSFSTGGRKSLTIMLAEPPPAELALRVVTYSDVQEVAVPFRFENLAMPESPELSEQQQALLVWTKGESPTDFPDLIVEAQGRWRTLEPVVQPAAGLDTGARFGGEFDRRSSYEEEMAEYEPEDMEAMEAEMAEAYRNEQIGRTPGREGGESSGQRQAPSSDNPLQIVIDLTGPLAQTAEAIGEINISAARTDIDTELAFEDAEVSGIPGDAVEEFVPLSAEATSTEDAPPGGRRLIVKLTPPRQPIGGLALLSGSLKFRTVRERTETVISNLQERVGKPQANSQIAQKLLTDRELAKFGLKPAIAIEPTRVMMRLVEGKDERISDVSLLDLNGLPMTDVDKTIREGTGNARGRRVYSFEFPGGVPQKIGMKISVNMGVKDIQVPIQIRDMPLPPMPEDL